MEQRDPQVHTGHTLRVESPFSLPLREPGVPLPSPPAPGRLHPMKMQMKEKQLRSQSTTFSPKHRPRDQTFSPFRAGLQHHLLQEASPGCSGPPWAPNSLKSLALPLTSLSWGRSLSDSQGELGVPGGPQCSFLSPPPTPRVTEQRMDQRG